MHYSLYWAPFSNLKHSLIANGDHKDFWHLKVTQALLRFLLNLVYIFLNQLSIFFSSACWIFRWVSSPPRWKIYSQVSLLKMFKTFTFSPVSQAIPTGVLRQGVASINSLFDWIKTIITDHTFLLVQLSGIWRCATSYFHQFGSLDW